MITVCESSTSLLWRSVPHIPAAWGQWARAKEGFNYLTTLARAHVPYRLGWAVTSARGEDKVSEVTISKLDHSSRPIPHTEISHAVDALVVGYGLTPGTELCRVLDCEFEFDARRGGFVPCRNGNMETSSPGIYAAGDCAGIGGAEMARAEGRIAGSAAAARLDHLADREARTRISHQQAILRREQRFARLLGDLFSPPPGLYALADADTIVCRCEQVTLGEIREAVKFGAQTVSDVKNLTRTGMGNCQGRTCGSIIAQVLAAETGRAVELVRYFSVRPPIHPLALSVIEELAE